jgi:hypothetical protein
MQVKAELITRAADSFVLATEENTNNGLAPLANITFFLFPLVIQLPAP